LQRARRRKAASIIATAGRRIRFKGSAYRDALAAAGLRGSIGRRGNPYDNAFAESFMKKLKGEAVYLSDYRTFVDVVEDLPRFINDDLQR
jgi:putative transposase